jgi:hypothetical protein
MVNEINMMTKANIHVTKYISGMLIKRVGRLLAIDSESLYSYFYIIIFVREK